MSDHPALTPPASDRAMPINWWQTIVLFCLFVAVTAAGLYWGQTHIVAGIENGYLKVAPERLDFGEVWVQDKFQWTLPITNTSSEPVEVLDIRSSCSCTSIEPTSLVIAPGATVDVKLTLDLTTLDPKEAAKDIRPFDMRVVPVIKGGLAQYTGWEVQGVVRNPLAFVPPSVDFGDDAVIQGKGSMTSGLVVEVTAHASTKALAVECDQATIQVEKVNQQESRFRLTVRPHNELPAGPFKFVP